MVLQNWRGLDLLTPASHGLLALRREQQCFYINKSKLVWDKAQGVRIRAKKKINKPQKNLWRVTGVNAKLKDQRPWSLMSTGDGSSGRHPDCCRMEFTSASWLSHLFILLGPWLADGAIHSQERSLPLRCPFFHMSIFSCNVLTDSPRALFLLSETALSLVKRITGIYPNKSTPVWMYTFFLDSWKFCLKPQIFFLALRSDIA